MKDTLVNFYLSNIIAIQAGYGFAMALSVTGKVYVWGSNTYGQLTNQFSSTFSPIPILLHSLPSISSIAIGSTIAGVETINGEILMWGNNLTSNIGNNTNSYYVSILKPVLNETGLPLLNNVKQLAVGYDHQTALKVDGSVWTWGNHSINVYNPNDNNSIFPNKIFDSTGNTYLTNIKQIAAGELHNLALTTNGYAYGWGTTSNYVLGNPSDSYYYKAVAIKNNLGAYTNNVKSIAASTNASMFLHNDNTISWCGRLYLNSLNSYSSVYPSKLKDSSGTVNLDSVISIAAGLNNIYAVTQDGKVWAAGNNDYGKLGLGDNSFHYGTVLVLDNTGTQPLSNIKSISIKENSVLALCFDGTIWAWGVNDYGQLGVGDETFSYLKRKVLDPSGLNPLSNISSISMGEYDALALSIDSTAWGWGWNVYGEVCDLTFNQRLLPVKVLKEDSTILENIIIVNAGTLLSSFLLADKTILSCGYNLDGQTGTKTSLGENVPSLTHLACRNDIPDALFSSSTVNTCETDCIQFTDNSTHIPDTWKWEIPGASPSISYNQNPIICFPLAGTYTVSLTTSNFLGTDSTAITNYITISSSPTSEFSFTIDTINKIITTSNTSSNANTYQWNFGDGSSSNVIEPQHSYIDYGTYIICLTSTNSCGSNIVCDTFSIIDPLSTQDFSSGTVDIRLYPNPTKNNLIIYSGTQIDSYYIINVLGEIVLSGIYKNNIDISCLAPGVGSPFLVQMGNRLFNNN